MSAESQYQEAFQAKEQRKDRHQHERVHHDTALLEEFLELFSHREFLGIGNRILDCLILEHIQRNHDRRRSTFASRTCLHHSLLHITGHFRRERSIPFKHLALQGARAEQSLYIAVVLRNFAEEHGTQAQTVHVHIGTAPHLRSFASVELRISQFMADQQIVHVALHRTNRIRRRLFGFVRGLFQANQAAVHAHRIIAHGIAKRLVDRKLHLRIQCIVGRFFGLSLFFGFFGQALACRDFFAHAAKISRKLGIAGIQFARCRLVFFGQLGFGITLAPVFGFKLFKRIGLLQANAGQSLYFALQVANFFSLQGILDSCLVFGSSLAFARTRPRPRKSGCRRNHQSTQRNILIQNHLSPPTTERLTGSFTT